MTIRADVARIWLSIARLGATSAREVTVPVSRASLAVMPISESHVGKTYPPTEPYVVSAAKIAEFAAALGDENPVYQGPDAVAPPTFAVLLSAAAWGAIFADDELDLSLERTVHGDQRFDWSRPLRAGDEVRGTLTIEKLRSRGTGEWITIAVALDTTAGERVCTATSTLLHNRGEAA